MYTLLLILMVLVSLLLIGAVLLQNAKSDGMQSSLGSMGGNKLIGVKKTVDGLEKATWILGITLLVFALASSTILKTKLKTSLRTINTDLAMAYDNESEDIQDEGTLDQNNDIESQSTDLESEGTVDEA